MTVSTRVHPAAPAPAPAAWGWAAAGIAIGLVAALLLLAPARWAAALVDRLSEGRLLLQATDGTLWNGSARLLLAGGEGSAWSMALPTRVAWQILPAQGGLSLRISSACCTPEPLEVLLQPRWQGALVRVSDSTERGASHWPAAWLAGLGTPWNTVQPQGDLELRTQGLIWQARRRGPRLSGRAVLVAHQLSSRLSMDRAVGTYRMTLEGGDRVRMQLETLGGELVLTGSGHLQEGRWLFEGEARAAPGREEALSSLLNVIGRRQGERSVIRVG